MPAVNDVGEPGAREPHARFDGRELETERLVRVTEVGQPDGKPRASRLLDLPPKPRHRASSRPYTTYAVTDATRQLPLLPPIDRWGLISAIPAQRGLRDARQATALHHGGKTRVHRPPGTRELLGH